MKSVNYWFNIALDLSVAILHRIALCLNSHMQTIKPHANNVILKLYLRVISWVTSLVWASSSLILNR